MSSWDTPVNRVLMLTTTSVSNDSKKRTAVVVEAVYTYYSFADPKGLRTMAGIPLHPTASYPFNSQRRDAVPSPPSLFLDIPQKHWRLVVNIGSAQSLLFHCEKLLQNLAELRRGDCLAIPYPKGIHPPFAMRIGMQLDSNGYPGWTG
jgi:hypothetical protein